MNNEQPQLANWKILTHAKQQATCLHLFLYLNLLFDFHSASVSVILVKVYHHTLSSREGWWTEKCTCYNGMWNDTKCWSCVSKQFPPTHRVTRPPTEGSELPSNRLALPPPICNDMRQRDCWHQRKNWDLGEYFSLRSNDHFELLWEHQRSLKE